MDKETTGIVISIAKQWWFKVNKKPVRFGSLNGATIPYIIKVQYVVGGKTYIKRKWIGAGKEVPAVGSELKVLYSSNKPKRAKVI